MADLRVGPWSGRTHRSAPTGLIVLQCENGIIHLNREHIMRRQSWQLVLLAAALGLVLAGPVWADAGLTKMLVESYDLLEAGNKEIYTLLSEAIRNTYKKL